MKQIKLFQICLMFNHGHLGNDMIFGIDQQIGTFINHHLDV